MSKFSSKRQFLDEIMKERNALDELLDAIPNKQKDLEIIDEMTVKDFLAHRTEWSKMMLRWYTDASTGKTPDVPNKEYNWNQLKELNADIYAAFKEVSLAQIEKDFHAVNNKLYALIEAMTEEELFTKKYYSFTGVSDLATYLNSATASHYRSARRHIQKWWKKQSIS